MAASISPGAKKKNPCSKRNREISRKVYKTLHPQQMKYNTILEKCQSTDQFPKNRNKDCTLTTEEMGIIECSKMYLILVYYMYQR